MAVDNNPELSPETPGDTDVERSSDSAADPERRAREENLTESLDYLIRNLSLDNRATIVASLVLATPALILAKWDVLALAVAIGALVFIRMPAYRFYRRRDLTRGLLIVLAGTWAITIPVVAAIPEALAIMIFTVIGPQLLAATFLDRKLVRILIVLGTLLVFGLGFLAFTQPGAGFDEYAPGWVFNGLIIGYLTAHILFFTVDVQEVNAIRLRSLQRLEQANAELAEAESALRDSRRRLVTAADAERVRIERNIHDGAQQQLVAIAVQLNLAADLAEDGTIPSVETLRRLHGYTLDAVEELRELAQGVYPAQLAEHGLVDALRGVARRSDALTVEATGTPELEDADEVALYFVCLEAIQNATKHAGPDARIAVTIDADAAGVRAVVSDDGLGFDADGSLGSRGLTNMADRIEALGGHLTVESSPGSGTTVEAWLPAATVRP